MNTAVRRRAIASKFTTACALATLLLPGSGADAMPRALALASLMPPPKPQVAVQVIPNGIVDVDPIGGEFPKWTARHEFYDTPSSLEVRWRDNDKPAVWGRWELYKIGSGGAHVTVASGSLASLPRAVGKGSRFAIDPRKWIPLHNDTGKAQEYILAVQTKPTMDASQPTPSKIAKLVHLSKGSQPVPPKADPYLCVGATATTERAVTVDIPAMTVNQTSSTAGDGDRDELYVSVGRLGPGNQSAQTRLPGADDYFEAKNGQTFWPGDWTDKDGDTVSHPILWTGRLKHNQTVELSITVAEQDNADLPQIKAGVLGALAAVASIATAAGGVAGPIVAAVANAAAGGGQFIPDTTGHDFVAYATLRMKNSCGYIQTTWVTLGQANLGDAGTVTNSFTGIGSFDKLPAHIAVVYTPGAGELNFFPDGVDYGPYAYAGALDEFFWNARGTSDSQYSFNLRTMTSL